MFPLRKPLTTRLLHGLSKAQVEVSDRSRSFEGVLEKTFLPPNRIFWRWKSSKGKAPAVSLPDGTFKAEDTEIVLLEDEKLKKKPQTGDVKFGKIFTDYMFSVKWDLENGWGTPKIAPIASFRMHPAARCLHYGMQLFEGLKAYKGSDEVIRLFRPDLNVKRLLDGAKRILLPSFDPNELIECIKRLVKLEQEWVPTADNSSLYIRPTYIANEPTLGVGTSNSALLYVLCCPVGAYFSTGFKPVSLYADPKYCRSWPGGCGDIKLGGNYAPTIAVQKAAEKRGMQQALWLHGKDHEVCEVGTMNIFFVIKNEGGGKELVTPPLNGLILPGVVRQSILEMCREWEDVKVIERTVTMSEVKQLLAEKRLREIFGTGTACIVCPVSSILYDGSKLEIPTVKQDKPVHIRIMKTLSRIYYGKVDHPWAVKLD